LSWDLRASYSKHTLSNPNFAACLPFPNPHSVVRLLPQPSLCCPSPSPILTQLRHQFLFLGLRDDLFTLASTVSCFPYPDQTPCAKVTLSSSAHAPPPLRGTPLSCTLRLPYGSFNMFFFSKLLIEFANWSVYLRDWWIRYGPKKSPLFRWMDLPGPSKMWVSLARS